MVRDCLIETPVFPQEFVSIWFQIHQWATYLNHRAFATDQENHMPSSAIGQVKCESEATVFNPDRD